MLEIGGVAEVVLLSSAVPHTRARVPPVDALRLGRRLTRRCLRILPDPEGGQEAGGSLSLPAWHGGRAGARVMAVAEGCTPRNCMQD